MKGMPVRQHCWNHEAREAVCRCPECSRSYCRECVTEHGARLLCAACLRRILGDAPAARQARRAPGWLMVLAGLLISWCVFLGMAAAVSEFSARIEQSVRETR